ncbi:MAG TPA: HEAT repeat domain-containing protein [Thermoanaerobaculia bacterium]|nr:HEAT repeat domain-containing protein [Thermoanaerobaculia bacterium]
MAEVAVFLLVGATMLGFGFMASRNRLGAWQDAAQSCGLQVVETSAGWSPRLRARAGLVYVRIESFGDKGRYTRIVIEAPAPPEFHSVTIRPESTFELGREIEIGDRHFDDTFFIQGPARLVFALLDAETRRLLVDMKEKSGLAITSGELRSVLSDNGKVQEVLRLLLDLRKRFAPPINVLQRLVENATEDPDPGVRLQNLLLLIRELSWSPETDGALRKACSDPVPEIRLRAARQLGAEAHGVLLELAENLEEDAVSAEALSILERELPFERVNAILRLALRRRRLQTARVCLEAIGRRGATAGVDLLVKVMEREHGELAPVAAEALGAIGSPAAEPSLIQALQRDDADVRVAAANALGRAGSAAAVLPLKEAAERSRLDLELRRATRQAIAEIKSRLQGASPGQLSLAGAEAGQLSLAQAEAEAEAGQLSLTEDPAGQLSLGDDQ